MERLDGNRALQVERHARLRAPISAQARFQVERGLERLDGNRALQVERHHDLEAPRFGRRRSKWRHAEFQKIQYIDLSSKKREREREEEEYIFFLLSLTLSEGGPGGTDGRPSGALQVERLDRLAAVLISASPAGLPWDVIGPEIAAAAGKLRTPNSLALGDEPRDLVVSACVIAALVPDKLGSRWVRWAAGRAPRAKSSRRDYFFGILARGLAEAGFCDAARRYEAMDQLQRACGTIVRWFDKHVDPNRRLTSAPPGPFKSAPPDIVPLAEAPITEEQVNLARQIREDFAAVRAPPA